MITALPRKRQHNRGGHISENILQLIQSKGYFSYCIEDDGIGIVKAENKVEAEQKVRKAYNTHSYLSNDTCVGISGIESAWFEDSPDIIEIAEF